MKTENTKNTKKKKTIIYIGEHFYLNSGTIMSPLYSVDGARYDYGYLGRDLEAGFEVHIRQATGKELKSYIDRLRNLQK
jgi:hypothetical protein